MQELTRTIKSTMGKRLNLVEDWWLEAWALERNGISRVETARKLHRDPAEITRVLGKLGASSPEDLGKLGTAALLARDDYLKLQDAGIYSRLLDRVYGPSSNRLAEYKARLLNSGRWFGRVPPAGYKLGEGRVLIPDAEAPRIKRFYERLARGEQYGLVARGERFHPRKETLRSRLYLGYVRFRGKEIQVSQPLISEELWKKAQPQLVKSEHGVSRVPFALEFLGSKYVPGDPAQVRRMREGFHMRAKGARVVDVAKHLGLSYSQTSYRLRDRKYVDAGIIDFQTWQKVQKVLVDSPWILRRKLETHEIETKIVEFLAKGPATSREISSKLGRIHNTVKSHLRRLRRVGKVEIVPGSWSYRLS